MLLPAMKPLADMRLNGVVPAIPVWIFFGDCWEVPRWDRMGTSAPEICIETGSPVARLDLRPVVGLKVCVMAEAWSEPLAKLLDRLKQYACAVELFVTSWIPETIGVRWDRGQSDDWIRIGDPITGDVA